MNNGYEYYYLFGLDIPLDRYKLGTIKQPKIKDYLSKDISIEGFFYPFVMNDILANQSQDKDTILKLKESMGELTFLLMNCIKGNRLDILQSIKESLQFLYNTSNVVINENLTIEIDGIKIDNSNFNILCKIVLEMLKIDKSKMKFEKVKKKEMSEIELEFERRRKAYEERVGKKAKDKGITILDMANTVIHSSNFKYEDILNMTAYQLKNSFEVIRHKDLYDTTILYSASPKFEFKDKQEHWIEKIKVDKSTLNQND